MLVAAVVETQRLKYAHTPGDYYNENARNNITPCKTLMMMIMMMMVMGDDGYGDDVDNDTADGGYDDDDDDNDTADGGYDDDYHDGDGDDDGRLIS